MRAIDLLADHWLKTRNDRKSHTIALAGGDLTVWWGPWTLGQQDRVFGGGFDIKVDPARETMTLPPAAFARILLVKAENEAGERLFADIEEREILSRVDPTTVRLLGTLILASLTADNAAGGDGAGEGGDGPKGGPTPSTPGAST